MPRRSLAIAMLCGALFAPLAADAEEAPWTLVRDRDGIAVHTRPVEGSGILEFKGTALVAASVERIRAILRNVDDFELWFPNTSEARLLSRENGVQFQYTVIDAPWPVSDRDNVFRSETHHDPTTGIVRIAVTAAPDRHPEHPDRVRVRHARGQWLLEPVEAERTRVTFTMHLEPGGGVPQWLLNSQVVETPFEALGNLRAQVAGR
ncbi:START domain-containing protein [Myxococcota bacterium]|nr:START domain-containing protein [Myxococcota bacterium]